MRAAVIACLLAACAAGHPPAAELPLDEPLTHELHGHVAVIDFWASWCAECKRTVPRVNRLASAYAGQDLRVVGVNVGESETVARAAARELGITYELAFDPELALSERMATRSLPAVLVIDRDGRVVHRGRILDREALTVIRGLVER